MKNNTYTLITGASSGIGRALAEECAAKGMNLLLIALPGDELMNLEQHIKQQYKVSCYSLGIDLAVHCSSTAVHEWVQNNGFKVNILINNVGIGSKGSFNKVDKDFYYKQLNLNVVTTCIMTRLFIDDLKANAPSHILNLGSMGGFFCLPEKVVYTASKAFVYAFSKSLRVELLQDGITVSVLCPGGTDSNHKTIAINAELKGVAKQSILMPHEVAKEGIAGMLKGKARIIPGFINKCSYHISRIVPEFIRNYFIMRAFKHVQKHKY
jgi:short-subunit dehydrogenase